MGNLFDNLESTAIVRNVYVAGADTTRGSGGGIAGVICENNKGIVEKCVVYNSELACDSYQGIIAGFNNELGIVRNCASVDCKIYAYDTAGGIVGRNEGKVENCYSNITIQGNYSAGGIVGINFGGTVSGCLGTVTTLPKKGDTPNTAQNIGGIVGVQAGSDAFIENCTSMYLPEDLYDLGDVGSVWGGYNTGGDNYLDNITDCVGAVKYTLDDIRLTEKEINGSTNETYLLEQLQKKRTSFASHHGASAETRKAENPVKKMIAGGNPDGKNKTVISNLNIKYTHIFENETKTYNAKKKFPMTQKELTVKEFSTPAKVKIKKVKIDQKNEQVTLTWDPVKKAEGYEVYIAKWKYADVGNKYGEYELETEIKSPNATEYLDKYLYKNNTYYYKVRAYYKVNGVKVYGPFSDIQEAVITGE